MSNQSAAQEPTMEEILASIRRIISEDSGGKDEAVEAAPPPPVAAAPEPEPEPEFEEEIFAEAGEDGAEEPAEGVDVDAEVFDEDLEPTQDA